MMPKSVLLFVLLIIMIAAVSPLASGQQFYSYVDETGVQVFTNIPPVSDEIPEVFFAEAQNKPQDLIFPPEMIEPGLANIRFDY